MGVFSVNLFKYFASLTFQLMSLSYLRNSGETTTIDMVLGTSISSSVLSSLCIILASLKDLPWLGSDLLLSSFWVLLPMILSDTQGSWSHFMEWGALIFLENFGLKHESLEYTDQSGVLCLVLPNSLYQ